MRPLFLLTNLVPLVGVVWFDWNLSSVLFLYWTENVVIGIVTILKLSFLEQFPEKQIRLVKGNLSNAQFFAIHFGFFAFGHGAALWSLFSHELEWLQVMGVSLIMLFNQLYIYHSDFIGKKEYENESIIKVMFSPYKRLFILHFTILAGGLYIESLGEPLYALSILTVLKIFGDLLFSKNILKSHESKH